MKTESAESLKVFLIYNEIRDLPHKARKLFAPTFDYKCPVPADMIMPVNGVARVFKRRFAVIQGGEKPRIIGVYYFQV